MTQNFKAPKLRFPGFTEDWEQRKVSDLLEERNEQAPESAEYPLMAFIANEGVAPKGERYDRGALVKDAENKNYKKTELGDFIYSSNNLETGSIGLNNYGNASISPVYSIFRPTGIVDSDFIGRRFVRKDFINSMVKWRQGVVYGQWRIHESDFLKIEVAVPSLEEQRKIGDYFRNLNTLITLHQRKFETLKKLKKGFLQKMFPKNGESVPEIRFPGFTDAWEQRELGNIANFINGRAYSQSELQDSGKYKILRVGNFYTNDSWYYSDMELDEKFYANKGDLLYTWSATFGPHIWDGDKVIYHYHIWKIELANSIDKTFAIQLLEKDKANILSNTNGSTMIHITKAGMEEKIVTIPAQIEEQMKIGSFLDKLDNLITLHQRKLDTLKKFKQGMLQQMFI